VASLLVLTDDSCNEITKNEVCRECGMCGVEGKWIPGFGGKTIGKETTWKTFCSWEDNIKVL
jgi:hypothetical protein